MELLCLYARKATWEAIRDYKNFRHVNRGLAGFRSNLLKMRIKVTVRSGRDGLDPDEVGGDCNDRRSVGSARCAFPGRRMESKAWPNGYVRQCPEWSNGFLFN